jgi:2'-deoxymugineic-acid 2'-dioxygenase/mugineic-acid 3-dioxygenase
MRDMEAVCHEFFHMPAEDKAIFYSEDKSIRNRLFSGSSFETLGEKYWLDVLELLYPLPSGDTSLWPHKPQRLREVVGNYTGLARGLAMEILQLLCEGLGLRPDFFVGDISGARVVVDINYYPPCPDPSRTLGLPPHCDRDLMTVLLPGAVPGLDIAYKGGWIKVLPVPNSIIINFGLQLEVVTNGLLRAVEHRASTNSAKPRLSVAAFIVPADNCVVGPAEEFVSEDNPPRYRTLTVGEFKRKHNVVNLGSSINQVADLENNQKEIM